MKTFLEIQTLSSDELLTSLTQAAHSERAFSIQVLWHLVEVDRRGLALQAGSDSLFSYCVKVLKYDPGSAHRRVKAAKLWRSHPEVARDLECGQLTLSGAAALQTYFDHCKKHRRPMASADQKKLIQNARGKSRRTLEAELIGELPINVPRPEARIKVVAQNLNRIELYVDDAFLEDLEKLRALRIHAEASGEAAKLIHTVIRNELVREQKRRFGARLTSSAPTATSPANLRRVTNDAASDERKARRVPIPATIRARVHQRDDGRCQFRDATSAQNCGSRFALEIDHVIPVEVGGGNEAENLRLLCSAHHRYRHCLSRHQGDGGSNQISVRK